MIRLARTIPMFALLAASCVLRTPTLTAHGPAMIGGSTTFAPPPPASSGSSVDAPPEDGALIEAGCTFNGSEIKGEPGSVHQVTCPAGCDKHANNVFGTDVYTTDTPVCAAAMHAGAISDRGGTMTLVLEAGRPAYRGTARNGIHSRDWGAYRGSFRFVGVVAAAAAPAAPAGPTPLEAGCTMPGRDIQGDPGTVFRLSCPAGCAKDHPIVWGTEHYTADSPVCPAAVHMGLISDRGGEATLILEAGRPAYRGGDRNGIRSNDHGQHHSGFRLKP